MQVTTIFYAWAVLSNFKASACCKKGNTREEKRKSCRRKWHGGRGKWLFFGQSGQLSENTTSRPVSKCSFLKFKLEALNMNPLHFYKTHLQKTEEIQLSFFYIFMDSIEWKCESGREKLWDNWSSWGFHLHAVSALCCWLYSTSCICHVNTHLQLTSILQRGHFCCMQVQT